MSEVFETVEALIADLDGVKPIDNDGQASATLVDDSRAAELLWAHWAVT